MSRKTWKILKFALPISQGNRQLLWQFCMGLIHLFTRVLRAYQSHSLRINETAIFCQIRKKIESLPLGLMLITSSRPVYWWVLCILPSFWKNKAKTKSRRPQLSSNLQSLRQQFCCRWLYCKESLIDPQRSTVIPCVYSAEAFTIHIFQQYFPRVAHMTWQFSLSSLGRTILSLFFSYKGKWKEEKYLNLKKNTV